MNKVYIVLAMVTMLVGLALTFLGVVFYENQLQSSDEIVSWWVWMIIATGLVLSVVGTLVSVALLGQDREVEDM